MYLQQVSVSQWGSKYLQISSKHITLEFCFILSAVMIAGRGTTKLLIGLTYSCIFGSIGMSVNHIQKSHASRNTFGPELLPTRCPFVPLETSKYREYDNSYNEKYNPVVRQIVLYTSKHYNYSL